jgi:DNA-binding transcriptional LysR family regulator
MELAALRYFLEVVDARSFAKAAAKLGLNASTLTRRVASLEDELGVMRRLSRDCRQHAYTS